MPAHRREQRGELERQVRSRAISGRQVRSRAISAARPAGELDGEAWRQVGLLGERVQQERAERVLMKRLAELRQIGARSRQDRRVPTGRSVGGDLGAISARMHPTRVHARAAATAVGERAEGHEERGGGGGRRGRRREGGGGAREQVAAEGVDEARVVSSRRKPHEATGRREGLRAQVVGALTDLVGVRVWVGVRGCG